MLNLQYINCIAMRNFKSFTFFLCFVLMHKFNSLQAQDTRQSILKVLADQRIAWNQGDLQTYMEGYWHSDSLVFIGKNGPKYGWDNTLANYKKSYPDVNAMGYLDFANLKITLLHKNFAYVSGSWTLTRAKDELKGYFTLLFKKVKGKWVIVSDHSS
jgi:ketosteroid isomerase-like protein